MSNNETEEAQHTATVEYICYNVVIPTISACGVLGNILNLVVLTRGQMKAPIYIYFTALAVADLVTCLLIFFSGIAKGAAAESYWWQLFDVYMHLGFGSVSTTISIAVIVMVTIERLILIRNGQLAKTYCTREMAVRVCWLILPLAIIFNIPYFMAFTVHRTEGIRETEFYNGRYFYFHNWARFVVLGLGPAVFLFAGNLVLILSLRQSYRRRQALLSQRKHREEKRLREQFRLTVTLVGIILMFLAGEFPTHLASRHSAASIIYGGDTSQLESTSFKTFTLVATVLMSIHYSCNFILYCALNSKFLSIASRVLLCLRSEAKCEISGVGPSTSEAMRAHEVNDGHKSAASFPMHTLSNMPLQSDSNGDAV